MVFPLKVLHLSKNYFYLYFFFFPPTKMQVKELEEAIHTCELKTRI